LRHTSGLSYGEITANAPVKEAYAKAGVFQADFPYESRGVTPAEEVERLAKAPLAHNPGEVLGVQHVRGRPGPRRRGRIGRQALGVPRRAPVQAAEDGGRAFSLPKDKMGRLASPFRPIRRPATRTASSTSASPPKNDAGGVGAVARPPTTCASRR